MMVHPQCRLLSGGQPVPRTPGTGFVGVDGKWAWNGSATGGAWTWVPEPGRTAETQGQGDGSHGHWESGFADRGPGIGGTGGRWR